MYICGVRIDQVDYREFQKRVSHALVTQAPFLLFTLNPEMIVRASRDTKYKETLNRADLNICDGFGTTIAARLYGQKLHRLPGADAFLTVARLAQKNRASLFLLGSLNKSVLDRAVNKLKKFFPGLAIAGTDPGPKIIDARNGPVTVDPTQNQALIEKINQSGATVLAVAFGMGKQEKWILQNMSLLPNIRVFMGVGGTFDYLSEIVPRAPRLMRAFGLEWLYRLTRQPRRFWRIFNAIIVFPLIAVYDAWIVPNQRRGR